MEKVTLVDLEQCVFWRRQSEALYEGLIKVSDSVQHKVRCCNRREKGIMQLLCRSKRKVSRIEGDWDGAITAGALDLDRDGIVLPKDWRVDHVFRCVFLDSNCLFEIWLERSLGRSSWSAVQVIHPCWLSKYRAISVWNTSGLPAVDFSEGLRVKEALVYSAKLQ